MKLEKAFFGIAGIFLTVVVVLFALSFTMAPRIAGGDQLAAAQIIEKSLLAFYYQGDDGKAKTTMELVDKNGNKRTRVLTMLRKDMSDGGNQKYFIYFHEPGDIRGMTFMVWKYPDKEDDRWIFVPSVDLIKRIAAKDSRSSFVGSDFTHEDVSGRNPGADNHSILREEKLAGNDAYVIQSIPKNPAEFTKKISWIDKKTFLPLKKEYYDAQNELYRVFTADKIENITDEAGNSYPTVSIQTMKNLKTGHKTKVTHSAISYNMGLKDADFSERNMRRPPRSWIN